LRLGAAFTRFMTTRYQNKYGLPTVISYGPCQFPTLGFVFERWTRIETSFQRMYALHLSMKDPSHQSREITFSWKRIRLFDHISTLAIYKLILEAGKGRVISTNGKSKRKFRPTPLATVERQKRASKYLRLSSEQTMEAAKKF
jgi:DNA topoisomerase-3